MLAACGGSEGPPEEAEPDQAEILPVSDRECSALRGWVPSDKPDDAPRWAPGDAPRDPVVNEIEFSEGDRYLWNGETISAETLGQYLDIVATMEPVPGTLLVLTGEESCSSVEPVTRQVQAALGCGDGTCRYAIAEASSAG